MDSKNSSSTKKKLNLQVRSLEVESAPCDSNVATTTICTCVGLDPACVNGGSWGGWQSKVAAVAYF